MLVSPTTSLLCIIDMQNRLAPAITDFESLTRSCRWLIEVAHELHIPVMATEQYPAGLGATVQPLLGLLAGDQIHEKIHFNAAAEAHIRDAIADAAVRQIVLAGCETHVCVLQSALGFKALGYQVFVVVDAVSSRHAQDHAAALSRLQQAGVVLLSREMLAFEWLERAGTPAFRRVSQQFIK